MATHRHVRLSLRDASCCIVLAVSFICSCGGSNSSSGGEAAGPVIRLDSAELAEARRERQALDSTDRDTTSKSRKDREFLPIIRQAQLFGIQSTLARLGYGNTISGDVDERTRSAIREFERRHGLPVTGDPYAPELQVAIRFVDGKTLSSFGLSSLTVVGSNATFYAKGTWSPSDPPRQTSEISCYRASRECRETTAYLLMGKLYTDEIEYVVERWNDDELVARSDKLCVSDVITINRASKSVILVRGSRGQSLEACAMLRTKSDDAVLRLVDGSKVADSLDAEALRYTRLGPSARAWWTKVREMKAK